MSGSQQQQDFVPQRSADVPSRAADPKKAVPDHVRRRMANTRGRDTKPELEVRRRLHALGYRYRVNARPESTLRYTADILFTRARVAVFIDGCFWHGCPEHFVMPQTRTEFWRNKIGGNTARDAAASAALRTAGWTVVRIWEHTPSEEAVASVVSAVGPVSR